MYLLNKENKTLEKIEEVTFSSQGLKERYDLQEWIDKSPNILGEDLLVIQKEFAGFDGTNERLDLLALDKKGNLVLIENKLDDSGRDVVWQALKYVSYCASMSKTEIISIYQSYLNNKNSAENSIEKLCLFFENDDIDEIKLNDGNNQRIILVAKDFKKEVTNTVLWLLDKNIEIQCIKLIPYNLNNQIIIYVDKIIPIPGAEEYIIKLSVKDEQNKRASKIQIENENLYVSYWGQLKEFLATKDFNPYQDRKPLNQNYWQSSSGISFISYNVVLLKKAIRVELSIHSSSKQDNKKVYDKLFERKDDIEHKFGDNLCWERSDESNSSKISYSKEFNRDNKDKWNEAIEWHYEYLEKLHKSTNSYVLKFAR